MMRWLMCTAIVLASSGQAAAIDIWLSTSGSLSPGSTLPASASEVPTNHEFASEAGGSIFIWARPDSNETLEHWSLRLTSDNLDILTFATSLDEDIANMQASANIEAYNSKMNGNVRWQHSSGVGGSESSIDLFGFSLTDSSPIAEGIGPMCTGNDLFCDVTSNSWLLAKVDYLLQGNTGTTNLFLQIGDRGISQAGESTSNAEVRFGDENDLPTLNGKTERNTSSLKPDGFIEVHPDLVQDGGGHDAADFDTDHLVGGNDFLIWQRGLGVGTMKSEGNATINSSFDSDVDAVDLAAWQHQFGSTTPPLSALHNVTVPEPASGATAASVFLFILARRRWATSI